MDAGELAARSSLMLLFLVDWLRGVSLRLVHALARQKELDFLVCIEMPFGRRRGPHCRRVFGHLFRSEPRTIGSRELVRQFGSLTFGLGSILCHGTDPFLSLLSLVYMNRVHPEFKN